MIQNPPVPVPSLITEAWTNYVIASGVAGWIDTDMSAVLGTGEKTVEVVIQLTSNPGDGSLAAGCRGTGSALSKTLTCNDDRSLNTSMLVKCNSAGHVDLYRNATRNTTYTLAGYWS